MRVVERLAPGAREKNSSILLQESAFASVFETPGMCFAMSTKLYLAAKKKRHLMKCIISSCSQRPELITDTTASLSQLLRTVQPAHFGPQMANAKSQLGGAPLALRDIYPWLLKPVTTPKGSTTPGTRHVTPEFFIRLISLALKEHRGAIPGAEKCIPL